MDLKKLHKDSELLRVYDLFEKEKSDRDYYAIHTLNRLYLDLDKSKESKEIKKIVKPFLSDFTIHPYLMLEGLTNSEEKDIIGLIFNDITKNLFPDKNLSKDIIKRLEYPSFDVRFLKNLLNKITSERSQQERFNDPKKAKELFLYYAEKQHMDLVLDDLELYSSLYHKSNDDGGGLDCSDD